MTCYDCDQTFSAATPDEMLKQMYPHYMEVHKAIITSADESEKARWMEQFHSDWEAA